MAFGDATNNNLAGIISGVIDFKITGITNLFTTPFNSRFVPAFAQYVCESANSANGNGTFSVGWTGPNYQDYILSDSFNPTVANESQLFQTGSTATNIFPANTVIKINIIAPDSGIALTGRIIFYGVYI